MLPSKLQGPYCQILVISILIGSVCFLTLTPAMYLTFHAWRWTRALAILERIFPPLLFLSVAACLLAYKRVKTRRALWQKDASHD